MSATTGQQVTCRLGIKNNTLYAKGLHSFGPLLTIILPTVCQAQPADIPYYVRPQIGLSTETQPFSDEEVNDGKRIRKEVVSEPGAKWLQIVFGSYELGASGELSINSLYDGQTQVFDQESLSLADGRTYIFNGEELEITLESKPSENSAYYSIQDVVVGLSLTEADAMAIGNEQSVLRDGEEAMCELDDRERMNENDVGRIMPIGCTGWLTSAGVFLTAGHCAVSSMQIIQYNVPGSLIDGTPVMPPIGDQYLIDQSSVIYENDPNEEGNDWAVFRVFPNTETGKLPGEAYNSFFRLILDAEGRDVGVKGFGLDRNPSGPGGGRNDDSQVLQGSTGRFVSEDIQAENDVVISYMVDTDKGNSGGPVLVEGGESKVAIGIHTNANCEPALNKGNTGTGFKNIDLQASIDQLVGNGLSVVYLDPGHPGSGNVEDGTVFSPYSTIEAAIDALPEDGLIVAAPGDYGAIDISGGLSLVAPVGPVKLGH